MDTQNLYAFQAVATLGSFSEAAETLHLTQPAVSKRIAVLEQQLGRRLFDRIGRQVNLTEAGRALLPRAQRILQEVTDTQQLMSDLSGEVRGRLSLATSHHIGLHRLPPILRKFSKRYPEVQLDLTFLDSEKAYEEILHGHFDLAVITLEDNSQHSEAPQAQKIYSHTLWQDPLSFVVSPEHPLAQKPVTTLTELSQYQAILPDISTHTTRLIKKLFDQQNTTLEVTMATNHLDTIKMMVSIGLGWGVLPDTLIDKDLQKIQVKKLKVTRQLGCIYHSKRSLNNAATAFLRELKVKA